MIIELGNYEPFGKHFLDTKTHLNQISNLNPIIDFSNLSATNHKEIIAFHKLFSISDSLDIDVGDRLDEKYSYNHGKIDNPAIQLEQEVYVKGSIVVWTRAGHVIKTLDYSDEDKPIQQVLFAWFPVTSAFFQIDPTNKPVVDINLSDVDSDKHLVEGYWDKRGPQSIIHFNKSKEEDEEEEENMNKKDLRSLNENEQDRDNQLQRRALCIVFQNCIKIHHEDGQSITAHLPFEIGEVVPLDIGVIVSRKHVFESNKGRKGKGRSASITNLTSITLNQARFKSTHKAENNTEASSYFVTVTHPLKGPCPVKSKEINQTGISTLPEPFTSPQKILFATKRLTDTGRLPVIVTLNIKENRHYIWAYERRKEKNESNTFKKTTNLYPRYPVTNKRKLNTNSINRRKYSKTDAGQTSVSARNRKQKTNPTDSPPRPHAQFHADYISDDEIQYETEADKNIYHELLDPSEILLRLLWREKHNSKISTKLKSANDIKSEAFLIHNLSGQELICIMNHTLGSLQVINLENAASTSKDCIEFSVSAQSAIPVNATRDNFTDLLYIDTSGSLQLFIDDSMPKLPIVLKSKENEVTVKLVDPVYDRFNAVYQDGTMMRYQLNLRPQTSLVRDCFAAIDCATTFYFPNVWYRYLERFHFKQKANSNSHINEWESFYITLLSFLKLKKRNNRNYYHPSTVDKSKTIINKNLRQPQKSTSTSLLSPKEIQLQQTRISNTKFLKNELGLSSLSASHQYEFSLDDYYSKGIPTRWIIQIINSKNDVTIPLDTFSDIVNSLHVIYEDYRIKKSMAIHANLLGYLLMQCAIILGNNEWVEYYESHGIESSFVGNLQLVSEEMSRLLLEPPNIEVCLRQMTPNTSSNPTLLSSFGVNTLEPALGHCQNSYAKTINYLWSLYGAINHVSSDKSLILDRMVANHVSRRDIEILSESIALPILEVLDELKHNPEVQWTKEAYNIIGRDDIYKQLQMNVTVCDPNTDTFKLPFLKDSDFPPNISDLMKDYSTTHVNQCIYETDVLNMETERLRFGFGGVIEKVRIILDATKVPEHFVPDIFGKTNEEVAAEHQNQVYLLLQRTLSLAAGRAIYAFGTHVPDLIKVLPIETINMSAKIMPLRTIVSVDESVLTNEFLNWPHFHNGVAAGLRISPSNHVNDSWIDFCNPPELEPQHGGVLLAMGLNGVLKKLPLVYYYTYLTQTSELVKIGFIMGAAVAYRKTKETKITKALSVYIPEFIPSDSESFNHSNLIQAAALLGMGLNFMNTCDRLMVSVMLKEIGKNAYSDPSILLPDYEGCALAAGFSLGFITLGVGDAALELIDRELQTKLYNLMTGRSTVSMTKEKEKTRSLNLDITSPSATIALGLMYLKTENKKVADDIEILETRPYLNYVRPDFLLLRVIAKNLIMWGTIKPSEEWIDNQIPDFITSNDPSNSFDSLEDSFQDQLIDDEVIKQAMYNIICGACLSMGLRFAGSRNNEAFKVLLNRLDFFIKLLNIQVTTPQQHVTKCAVRTCIDVICTAAAMVMAGTGNRELIGRLEQLNSRISEDMKYGNHMAVSMSLGLLFIGLGGYTLTTTNESIAGLLCAFYPVYPLATDDNRYHLQAFRHLWVMAVDSRWLMPFDVANKKPCRVPMRLELYADDGSQEPASQRQVRQVRIEAPTVVPDYKLIKSIQLDGERYWPLSVNMTTNGRYQNSIIKSGVIYVKRKDKKKSYEDDPSGRRNLTWK